MAGKKADTPVAEDKPVSVETPKAASGNEDNLFAAICYLVGVIVSLFVLFTEKKQNKFLAFHAWQSLILCIVAFVVLFGFGMVVTVLSVVTGGLGGILGCLMFPLWGVFILAFLFGAYKAYQGETYKMPIIGDFAAKQVK